MPLFVLSCLDKPQSLALRMATREAHLAYAGARRDMLKLGGPYLDEAGDMAGSLMIVEADDIEAVRAFNADDPYTLAGLWRRVEITPFRVTLGDL